jgi:hypothetical protein
MKLKASVFFLNAMLVSFDRIDQKAAEARLPLDAFFHAIPLVGLLNCANPRRILAKIPPQSFH